MDAHRSYILEASHTRLADLRREAAEHAMSKAARSGRPQWWTRARHRLKRRPPVAVPVPVRCPVCQAPLALTVDELVGSRA